MHISEILDQENLAKHIESRNISRRYNEDGYSILTYTQQVQYTNAWDNETLTCRGLTLDPDDRVQARPFVKFFNLGQYQDQPLPEEPFDVYEKVDGSLIIASRLPDGQTLLTTKGSFDSPQAVAAREIWLARHSDIEIPPGQTWCFEFIAPWNRIVVDYGKKEALVLLGCLDNITGAEVNGHWRGETVRTFDGISDFDVIERLMATLPSDEEGYVLKFRSGLRVKAKGHEYVRLHKIVTGVTARTIWECLANDSGLGEILERVPDEFFDWVTKIVWELNLAHATIEAEAQKKFDEVKGLPTRKDQALAIQDYEYKAIVFRLLDGRSTKEDIWKRLRPQAERPFKDEE